MIGVSEKRSPDSDGIDQKIKVLIVDIEGTTTSISFVKDTLFPYIRENLRVYVKTHLKENEFVDDLLLLKKQAESDKENGVEGFVPIPTGTENDEELCEAVCNNILWQMDLDRKTKALKQLQGHVMRDGYLNGKLKGHVYDDVQPALKSWTHSGRQVYVYSSGSVAAQKLLFGFSEKGDLLEFFSGHFDTEVGPKIEASSYSNIAKQLKCEKEEILFLTDVPTEAKAAQAAGLQVVLVSRPGNAPLTDDDCGKFRVIKSFDDIVFETSAKRTKLCIDENKSESEASKEKSSLDTPMDVDDGDNKCVKVSEGSSLTTKPLDNVSKIESAPKQEVADSNEVKSIENKAQESKSKNNETEINGKDSNEVESSSLGKENGENACSSDVEQVELKAHKDSVEEKVDSTTKGDSSVKDIDTVGVGKESENKDITSRNVSNHVEEKIGLSEGSIIKPKESDTGSKNVVGADSKCLESTDSDAVGTSTVSEKNVCNMKTTESSDKKTESPVSEETVESTVEDKTVDKENVKLDSKEKFSAGDKIEPAVESSTSEKTTQESMESTNQPPTCKKTDESNVIEKSVESSSEVKTVEVSNEEKSVETPNERKSVETSPEEKAIETSCEEKTVESNSTKEKTVESNYTKEKTDESTSTKEKTDESTSTKEKTVESASTKEKTVESASTKEKTVESASTNEKTVDSASTNEKSVDSASKEKTVESSGDKGAESSEDKLMNSSNENNSKSMTNAEITKSPKKSEDTLEQTHDSDKGKTEKPSTNEKTEVPIAEDKGDTNVDKSKTPQVNECSVEITSEPSQNESKESCTEGDSSSKEKQVVVKDDKTSNSNEDVKMDLKDKNSEPKTDKMEVNDEKSTGGNEENRESKMDESNNISANGTEVSDSSNETETKNKNVEDDNCKKLKKDLQNEDSMETDCQKSDACEDTTPMDVDEVSNSEETKRENGNDEAQNSKVLESKTNGVEESSKMDDIKVKKSSDDVDSMEVVTPAQS